MMRLTDIEFSTAPEDLACYGFDASGISHKPRMVAWPKSESEVSRIMKYASETRIPVIPRGAGTGMTGGSVPVGEGGAIVLSLEKLNRILEIDESNLTVMVEPGVINGHLQSELDRIGLFYPPDPASMKFCTLGGNVAENAGGPRALKYGVTRDYVMRLEAVLPGGEIITTGVGTRKGVVGYDLTRLLVGSEGTLAVITKILLRLLPAPEGVKTMTAMFDSVESAGRAVANIIASKIIPRTLEFMDASAIAAVENYKTLGMINSAAADKKKTSALLLIELDGHPAAIDAESERAAEICASLNAEVRAARSEPERQRLWEARRAVSPALHHLGMKKINEDIVVPRSRLAAMLVFLESLSEQSGVSIVNFGHAGDGNIHVNIMARPDNYEKAVSLVRPMFSKVLELGGTISGEHGIGLAKSAFIEMEIKRRELELMRGIKNLFDPHGILNPGKVFP